MLPAPTDAVPAPALPLTAILQLDGSLPVTIQTSWQYQSWANSRSPESRITGNLDPIRGPSLPGDILLIERSLEDDRLYRVTIVTQAGPLFWSILPRTSGKRWGVLTGGTVPVREAEIDDALVEMEQRQAAPFDPFDASLVYQPATKRIARSRAFRKAVVAAYDGKCAICGGGVSLPDGRTEIEAAHVIPRGSAGADDVRNGLALCRLHHWAFDNLLIGITPSRAVVCSSAVTAVPHNAVLFAISGVSLRTPTNPSLALDDYALSWAYARYSAA